MRYKRLLVGVAIVVSYFFFAESSIYGTNLPTEKWYLEEQWRLDADSNPIIYGTTEIQSDGQGRVYILNAVLKKIFVYDKYGNIIRSILRKGEGPGDVTNPLDFCLTRDNNICVLQTFPSKLMVIDTVSNYLEQSNPNPNDNGYASSSPRVYRSIISGGNDYLLGISFMNIRSKSSVETIEWIWKLNSALEFEERILEKRVLYQLQHYQLREADVFQHLWNQVAIDRDGNVYYSPAWNEYRIVKYPPSGSARDFIKMEYKGLPRDDTTRKSIAQSLQRSPVFGSAKPSSVKVEDNWPTIISMRVIDGLLWVLTSRGFRIREQGEIYRYDVFALDSGDLVKRVSLRGPSWNEYPTVHFLNEDRIAVCVPGYDFEGSDKTEEKIIICRVEKDSSSNKNGRNRARMK